MENVISFDTVGQYNQYNNNETRHPLVSVIDLGKSAPRTQSRQRFGMYTMFFKEIKCGDLRYGCNFMIMMKGRWYSLLPGK